MLVGKTSLLDSFVFMSNMVLHPIDDTKDKDTNSNYLFKYNKFMFDETSKKSSIDFEVYILTNGNKYQYGFSIDENIILSEWLYVKTKRGFSKVFERDNNKISANSKFKELAKYSTSNISENSLFLPLAANMENNIHTSNVYSWFSSLVYLNYGNSFLELFQTTINNSIAKDIFDNINKSVQEGNKDVDTSKATADLKDEYLNFLKSINTGIDDLCIKNIKPDSNEIDIEFYTIRKNSDGNTEMLPFDLESEGTKKMFLLYMVFSNMLKTGGTLFIDELDSKLHPLLVKYILTLFHNPDINTGNAQLIYSTHDVTNLNKDIFRRDEIWFVEKDINNVSNLFSLSDYIDSTTNSKIRNDASYNKDYLTGRYGAIPVLREFGFLDEK